MFGKAQTFEELFLTMTQSRENANTQKNPEEDEITDKAGFQANIGHILGAPRNASGEEDRLGH